MHDAQRNSDVIVNFLDSQARKHIYYEYIINPKGQNNNYRAIKVLEKNDGELYRFMLKSPYLFKTINPELPALRYPSVTPFCKMYQTAIDCIVILYNPLKNQHKIKRIYKKGQYSQSECEQKVKQAIIKYHIKDTRTPIMVAKAMKLI